MQEKSTKVLELDLQDYYGKLDKSEKGALLRYLIKETGLSASSLISKFSRNSPNTFNNMQKYCITDLIKSGLWRK